MTPEERQKSSYPASPLDGTIGPELAGVVRTGFALIGLGMIQNALAHAPGITAAPRVQGFQPLSASSAPRAMAPPAFSAPRPGQN